MQSGQTKAKANGQTAPAKFNKAGVETGRSSSAHPNPSAGEPKPAHTELTPMQQVERLFATHGNRRYLEGMRRAMKFVAIAIGQLDGESKQRLTSTLEQLEAEIVDAEKQV